MGQKSVASDNRFLYLFFGILCAMCITLMAILYFLHGIEELPKSSVLKADLKAYAHALDFYRIQHNEFPPVENWNEQLLKDWAGVNRVPQLDPWREPYIYEKKADSGKTTVRLYSSNSDLSDPDQVISITSAMID